MGSRKGTNDWDIWVVSLAWFSSKLRPVVIFGTILVVFLAAYAVLYWLGKH